MVEWAPAIFTGKQLLVKFDYARLVGGCLTERIKVGMALKVALSVISDLEKNVIVRAALSAFTTSVTCASCRDSGNRSCEFGRLFWESDNTMYRSFT